MRAILRLLSVACAALIATPALAAMPDVPKDMTVTQRDTGDGPPAEMGDTVSVHYTGWLMDGTKFDSSEGRGPISFTLGAGRVIPGWEMGLMGLRKGGQRELVIPSRLAYGKRGAGGVIPPGADLKFSVELVGLKKAAFTNIDNAELANLLDQGVTLIDIRRPEEWAETGIIDGAETLTLFNARGQMQPDFFMGVKQRVAKDAPVAVICRTGSRTLAASKLLTERLGYKNVYNVANGITAWIDDGRPTVKPE